MPGPQALQGCPFNPYIVGQGTLTPLQRPEGRPPYILPCGASRALPPYNIQHNTKRHLPTLICFLYSEQ